MDEADLGVLAGEGRQPAEIVLALARQAKAYYLDGVVCSGLEVADVKAACGSKFLCLTPGIRPAGSAAGDQRRVVTPAQAVADGADFLVVGRPITGSADPKQAARQVLEQMQCG
jgi:orotidine-5'-phosphate decarboxylase